MRVFIANFGHHNYAWPACLSRATIATMNDARVQPLWVSREKDSYINTCMRELKTTVGLSPTRSVASRWYNLMSTIADSDRDLWIHREKEQLWWTISTNEAPEFEEAIDPYDSHPVVICHKPCEPWRDLNRKGNRLLWDTLHPRAKEFLFTEGTLQQLSADNATYALELIEGGDLRPWHETTLWRSKLAAKKNALPATVFNARQKTITRMAMTAIETTKHANGQQVLKTVKEKNLGFGNILELEKHLGALLDSQEGLCALTDLKLEFDGDTENPDLVCSLDRIDSDGHYELGNLQIVCKFANRWKGASKNEDFLRLVGLVRGM